VRSRFRTIGCGHETSRYASRYAPSRRRHRPGSFRRRAAHPGSRWSHHRMGVINARLGDSSADTGKVLNQEAIDSVRRNGIALKGPMTTAIAGGAPSVNVALRKTLDLYANLRPV